MPEHGTRPMPTAHSRLERDDMLSRTARGYRERSRRSTKYPRIGSRLFEQAEILVDLLILFTFGIIYTSPVA